MTVVLLASMPVLIFFSTVSLGAAASLLPRPPEHPFQLAFHLIAAALPLAALIFVLIRLSEAALVTEATP